MLVENRIAIVTGAASRRGLGRATALLLAQHGAKVALLDLREGDSVDAAATVGSDHIGIGCDVTDKAACQAAVETVLSAWGRIDILVNNAGIVEPNGVMDVAPEDYDRVTDVNLRGTLYMSQAVIPTMRKQGEGSIVNVSSVAGQRGGGVFGGAHYAAAKAGVLGLSKAMARELAPDNVRVNAVCPGYIDTDIVVGRLSEDRRAKIIEGIPMGRPGDAVDVAGVCVFLGCSLSAYVTGAVLDVNGGSHIH